jgi:hypothetical protein
MAMIKSWPQSELSIADFLLPLGFEEKSAVALETVVESQIFPRANVASGI